MPALNRQLVEAASWRLAAELARRDPRLTIRELHPGGGEYDCLALLRGPLHVVHLNRAGSVHVKHSPAAVHAGVWREVLHDSTALGRWIAKLSHDLGLPAHVAPTTPRTLVYRAIAATLSHACFRRELHEVRSGLLDTSGHGGGVRNGLFKRLRGAGCHYAAFVSEAESHPSEYWFVLIGDQPRAALHESGVAWVGQDEAVDLHKRYETKRRIAPLVHALFGDLFD